MAGTSALHASGLRRRSHRGDRHARATALGGHGSWRSGRGCTSRAGRRWRVLVGVLIGLAFVEKMAAVLVVLPAVRLAGFQPLAVGVQTGGGGKAAWIDGGLTTLAMLLPLGVAFLEILRLKEKLPPPLNTNLFIAAAAERGARADSAPSSPGLGRATADGAALSYESDLGTGAAGR